MKKFIKISNKSKKNNISLKEKGMYIIFFKNFSGEIKIQILSEGVRVYLFGIYQGKGSDDFRLRTVQHHLIGNSHSESLIKGVFERTASFWYEGTIKIEKKAQHSHAFLKNQNLSLSDKVFIESRPFLEIYANDVFCTHGVTTSTLEDKYLYYLLTRAIDREKAKKLLVSGFLKEVENKIRRLRLDDLQ